ncbi:MAG: FAD-dependent oxidoreductase, partial [Acidimicrobiaceae bacterium]|nr:FAD-dependent oxidoreductase [Acidimicrobiaceae bacterium]
MKSSAQVVVVGGGVVGASVLYHLTKAGWTDVVLVERTELTAGSTWHSAGGMHTLNSDPNVARLQRYTIELYAEIERISGQDCGVHMPGGVMLADTPERLDWLKMTHARGRYLGMETELVSVAEAAELVPLIDPQHFVGALVDAHEGHVDPAGVTHAFARAARAAGAEVYRNCWARAIERRRDGGWRVLVYDTASGEDLGAIDCEHVVNCGGLWAREVGRMVGLELPVLAMEHTYIVTEPLEEVIEYNRRTGSRLRHVIDFGGEMYMRQ